MDLTSIKETLTLENIAIAVVTGLVVWLCVGLIKYSSIYGYKLLSKFNKEVKREILMYEIGFSLLAAKEQTADEPPAIMLMLTMIKMALHKGFQGLIYILIGLIAQPFIGNFSLTAYIIAAYYMFLASRVVRVDLVRKKDKTWHLNRVTELREELEKINSNS